MRLRKTGAQKSDTFMSNSIERSYRNLKSDDRYMTPGDFRSLDSVSTEVALNSYGKRPKTRVESR